MLEKTIEKYLVQQVKSVGGLALKWVSPGHAGVPDRIVFFPGGCVVLVELKAPGKKPTPLQTKIHENLKKLGAKVDVIDSMDEVKKFISRYTLP